MKSNLSHHFRNHDSFSESASNQIPLRLLGVSLGFELHDHDSFGDSFLIAEHEQAFQSWAAFLDVVNHLDFIDAEVDIS